jgi:hypothetical protein
LQPIPHFRLLFLGLFFLGYYSPLGPMPPSLNPYLPVHAFDLSDLSNLVNPSKPSQEQAPSAPSFQPMMPFSPTFPSRNINVKKYPYANSYYDPASELPLDPLRNSARSSYPLFSSPSPSRNAHIISPPFFPVPLHPTANAANLQSYGRLSEIKQKPVATSKDPLSPLRKLYAPVPMQTAPPAVAAPPS